MVSLLLIIHCSNMLINPAVFNVEGEVEPVPQTVAIALVVRDIEGAPRSPSPESM